MSRYRYRMESHLSRHVVSRFSRARGKLGDITCVVANRFKSWRKGVFTDREYVTVYGTLGTARMSGCCWGYPGEGPHAVRDLLCAIGVPHQLAREMAFETPRLYPQLGIDWQIARDAGGAWGKIV